MLYLPTTCHTPDSKDHRRREYLNKLSPGRPHNKKLSQKLRIFHVHRSQFQDRKLNVPPTSQVHTSAMLLLLTAGNYYRIFSERNSFLGGQETGP